MWLEIALGGLFIFLPMNCCTILTISMVGPTKDQTRTFEASHREEWCVFVLFFILSICKQKIYQENDTRKTAFYFTVILGNSTKIPLSRSEVVMPPAEGWMINLFLRVTCKRTAPYWDVCKTGDPFFLRRLYKTAWTPSHLWFNMDWVWVGSLFLRNLDDPRLLYCFSIYQ